MFYSTSIFTAAGLVGTAALYATVGMGLAQVSSTMVSMIFVEKAGRRTLLLVGYGGMFVVTGLLLTFMLLKVCWGFNLRFLVRLRKFFFLCTAPGFCERRCGFGEER